MNNKTSLLRVLGIVIGEMDERIVSQILEKLEEKESEYGGTWKIDFEILLGDLCNEGEIKIDI